MQEQTTISQRVWRLALAMLWMASLALVACGGGGDDKAPYRPAIWGEPPGGQVLVDPDPLVLDGSRREGRFEEARFQGFLVYGGALTTLTMSLEATGGADPVLIVYGPRRDGDIWGRHVAVDDDSGEGNAARIANLRLPAMGEYLVMVTTYSGEGAGGFTLSLSCSQGCNALPCQQEACHAEGACQGGFLNDARGCRSCQCVDQCATSADCGASQICVDGQCRDDCTCSGELAEVCGADGVTYANACEARCLGIDVVSFRPCANECPELGCSLACEYGHVLDSGGCPTCACQSPCEVCDERIDPVCSLNGVTWPNECLADCRGETVAYAGRCNTECAPLRCELQCQVYRRDERGCPTCACEQEVCPDQRDPVCGVNGVTYNNPCEADRAGVEVAFDDVCPPLCRTDDDCGDQLECLPLAGRACDPSLDANCPGVCVLSGVSDRRCESDAGCWPGFTCVEGTCALSCNCSPVYNPVCGVDGRTYLNSCVARCARRAVAKIGACCEADSLDGCGLRCENGFAVDGDGCPVCECREAPPCECQPVENPVCGSDGQTYRNPCEAECAGVTWRGGGCP